MVPVLKIGMILSCPILVHQADIIDPFVPENGSPGRSGCLHLALNVSIAQAGLEWRHCEGY
jgi:hypothetical protein